ncbi:hypothetical protein GOV14_03415 [Candidatus Pacearchaeota archaeon]|nr:hypothetical protein [Candidatus Pacearchaeota archaeon]
MKRVKLPYWLLGGILALVFFVCWLLLTWTGAEMQGLLGLPVVYSLFTMGSLTIDFFFRITGLVINHPQKYLIIDTLIVIINFIEVFLIGTFFGWLYGKYLKRKKGKQIVKKGKNFKA